MSDDSEFEAEPTTSPGGKKTEPPMTYVEIREDLKRVKSLLGALVASHNHAREFMVTVHDENVTHRRAHVEFFKQLGKIRSTTGKQHRRIEALERGGRERATWFLVVAIVIHWIMPNGPMASIAQIWNWWRGT